ncbi:MAG TPA: DUF5329 domain-containing protein [Patescibacteria group bacterium]|nr:DUF5329 domain-containing protein [Patescibacteria group bacterium]
MKTAAILLACAFFTFFPGRAKAAPNGTEMLAITHLFQFVREANAQFIRNGVSYNGGDAAAHMEKKWGHAKDRLSTAEEFIDYVASRSSLTGKPYMVKTADGKTIEARAWLYAELNRFRIQQDKSAPAGAKPRNK